MILFSLMLIGKVQAQSFHSKHFGISIGLLVNLGTHVRSIGLVAKGYYTDHFYQVNGGTTVAWNGKSYGERKKYFESRNYFGLVFLGGKKDNTIDFQLDGVMHQTNYRNALGYSYIWYIDNAGTSQLSGAFGFQINKFSLLFENDIFAGQGKDRFRTGHIFSTYRYQNYKFGSGIYLWTGATNGVPILQNSKCPYGYKDLSSLPFGKTSHGILYASGILNTGYGQIIQAKIGYDSEQVRQILQNKLIHDLVFLPKRFPRNTPNYPRLNAEGFPVFEKKEMRKNKSFFQVSLNENWSN